MTLQTGSTYAIYVEMRDSNYLQIKPGIILNGRHMTYIKKEDGIHYFTDTETQQEIRVHARLNISYLLLDRSDTGKEHRE